MKLTYRIEGRTCRFSGRREYALFVTRHEGRGLFDFSSYHFSTAGSRATLKRRVSKLFPQAVPQ